MASRSWFDQLTMNGLSGNIDNQKALPDGQNSLPESRPGRSVRETARDRRPAVPGANAGQHWNVLKLVRPFSTNPYKPLGF